MEIDEIPDYAWYGCYEYDPGRYNDLDASVRYLQDILAIASPEIQEIFGETVAKLAEEARGQKAGST